MLLLWLLLSTFVFQTVVGDCSAQNDCNGHGACQTSTNKCLCYDGWGSENDISFYKAPDCSQRVCPAGKAWADIPTSATTAHSYMECSNRGVCDRTSGLCKCFAGFTGAACDRTECPNDCSGHGSCYSIKQMARLSNALPLGPNTFYEGFEVSDCPHLKPCLLFLLGFYNLGRGPHLRMCVRLLVACGSRSRRSAVTRVVRTGLLPS